MGAGTGERLAVTSSGTERFSKKSKWAPTAYLHFLGRQSEKKSGDFYFSYP